MRSIDFLRATISTAAVLGSIVLLPACDLASTTGPSCLKTYCGDISMRISMQCPRQGFGYSCTGTVTLTFEPSPPDMTVKVRLNAQSISGRARTHGRSTVEVPISGSAVACPFQQPSTLVVTDADDITLESITFRWERGGCDY